MSFVKIYPEAVTAATGKLQGIGSEMAAQNAAAAAPTTGVVPAAADEVSALQATQFAAYGTWYQHVSAQATAIHEMLVNTLGTSAGSYGATESANQVAVGTSPLSGILGGLLGSGSSSSSSGGLSGISGSAQSAAPSSPLADIASMVFGNSAADGSILLSLLGGGVLSNTVQELTAIPAMPMPAAGLTGAVLMGAVGPVGSAGPASVAGAPVVAGAGQAPSIGGLSVPPSWAGQATASSPAQATLAGAGWTAAAPQSTPVTTLPAGMPSVASAGHGGFGFGTPRYGVKPVVVPRPAVI